MATEDFDVDASPRVTVAATASRGGSLTSRSLQQQENATLRTRIAGLQLELEASILRETQAGERIRAFEATMAELRVSHDRDRLVSQLKQAEGDLTVLKSARRNADVTILDLRTSNKQAEYRVEEVRSSATYRLGQLLIASGRGWRSLLALPRVLLQWHRDNLRIAAEKSGELIPQGTLPEYQAAVETAIAHADRDGIWKAEQWTRDQRFRGAVLSRVLIELARHSRATDPDAAVALAKAAVEADPNENRAKQLAFTMMDAGSVTQANAVLRSAIAAGATLNGTEARRAEELQALNRLHRNGLMLPLQTRRLPAASTPRILLLTAQSLPYHWTATALRTHGMAQVARHAGLHVEVVTPPGYPPNKSAGQGKLAESVDAIPHHRLGFVEASTPLSDDHVRVTAIGLARLAQAMGATAIVAPADITLAYPAAIASRVTGAALVLDVHSTVTSGNPSGPTRERDTILVGLETALAHEATAIFARSNEIGLVLGERAVGPDRVAIIPETMPTFAADAVLPQWRDDPALAGRLVIGYIGDPWDDIDLEALPAVLDSLVRRGLNVGLAVFGVGTRFQRIKDQTAALGHAGRSLFGGRPRLGGIGQAFATIDIFLAPDRRSDRGETRMRSRFECSDAMRHGRCIAVGRSSAAIELLNGCALFVDGDADAIADALVPLVLHSEERGALATAAASRAGLDRDDRVIAERFRALETMRSATC